MSVTITLPSVIACCTLSSGVGKQWSVAGYLSMPLQMPYGCHVGCQGFVHSLFLDNQDGIAQYYSIYLYIRIYKCVNLYIYIYIYNINDTRSSSA